MIVAIAISATIISFGMGIWMSMIQMANYERTSTEMSQLSWAGVQYYLRNNVVAAGITDIQNGGLYGKDITKPNLYNGTYGLTANSKLVTASAILPGGILLDPSLGYLATNTTYASTPVSFGLADTVKSIKTWLYQQ